MKKKNGAKIAMVFVLVLLASVVGFGCSSFDDIVSVDISSANLKVAIEDVQNLKINVTGVRRDGKLVRLAASDYTLDVQDITEPGKYPLTVTYKNKAYPFILNVVETKVVATFSRSVNTTTGKASITPEEPGTVWFAENEDYTDETASNWSQAYKDANRNNMRRIHEYANPKVRFYENGKYVISYDYLGYRAGTLTNAATPDFVQVGERVTTNAIANRPVITGKYAEIDGYYSLRVGSSLVISVPGYVDYLHGTLLCTVSVSTSGSGDSTALITTITQTVTLTNLATYFHVDAKDNFVDGFRSTATTVRFVLDRAV